MAKLVKMEDRLRRRVIGQDPALERIADAIRRALAAGSMTGLGMNVDDCRRTYEELSAKGVTFLQEPAERPL